MIIYFADRRMQILGLASTELREGFTISDDLKSEDVDTGVATFEGEIHWTDESRALAESCTSAGNYLLRSNNGENEFYTIIEAINDTKAQSIDVYAEDAGMDLLNETVGAFEADEAHPIAWYIEKYAEDTGFEIGVNEIESLTRKLKWEGEATAAERIASVATEFDNAEISYSFEIKNLTITHKYINIWKKRGNDTGCQLRLNRDVDRIVTTTSVADLATALYVTGGTPEGKDDPITLEGYDYDDGDLYVIEGTPILCKRSALEVWSRYVWAKEPNQIEGYTGNIIKQWSYDTTSQSELCNRAITQLNKVSDPAVNYEIDIQNLPDNVGIGDYVDIVDEQGELYLSSRILKLTTSVCKQKQTATLGEFLIKESGISETVRELAEQFSQLAKSRQFYTWIAYADDEYGDGISLDPTDKTYMGTATNMTTAEVDISDPSVFKWALIQGEGVGIENIVTWYGKSDSPTVVPTEWQDEPYELLRNEYQWSYIEYDYTNGVVVLTDPHIIAYYDYLNVDELDAKVANIESLLAGNAGVGDLQAIYITGANAVIDDAVIVNALMGTVLADIITSRVIYTDYIKIANNEDESLLIDGSTIQINDGTTVRVQMGLDSDGNYNFYIFSADGDVIWDALGLTEAGLIGNGAIIRDVAVADDANISGYKLNLEEVVDIINEDGSLEIDASAVTIDGERLDYRLTTITDMVENLSLEGLKDWKLYFCAWYSGVIPPYDPDDLTPAICGQAICGRTVCGLIDTDALWTLTEPTTENGEYIWVRWWMLHDDDSEEWGDPFLLTDNFVRDHTTVLQTELTAVQGQITAKVWMDDIYETVDTAITTVWSEIDVQLGQISLEVGEIYTDLDEHYAKKASLVLQLDEETGEATMSAEADLIRLTSGQLVIESDGFSLTKDGYILINTNNLTLTADGSLTATNAYLENAYLEGDVVATSLYATDAYLEGVVDASSGHIGNWIISTNKIYNDLSVFEKTAVIQAPRESGMTWVFAAGGETHSYYSDCPFRVSKDGAMYAESGRIGYFDINDWWLSGSGISLNGRDGYIQALDFMGDMAEISNIYGVEGDCPKIQCADDTCRASVGTVTSSSNYSVAYINGHSSAVYINSLWETSSYSSRSIAVSSSDIRLKDNVEDSEISGLELLDKIQMRQFDWKDTGEHVDIGFIADEIDQFDPDLSVGGGYDENGCPCYKSIDTLHLLAYVVKAIQELNDRIGG